MGLMERMEGQVIIGTITPIWFDTLCLMGMVVCRGSSYIPVLIITEQPVD